MFSIRTVVLCLLALFAATGALGAKGRVFLFPPSGTDVITVLDADSLAALGSFTGTSTMTAVLGTADGKKFYAISRTSVDTVVVVDAEALLVTRPATSRRRRPAPRRSSHRFRLR